MPIARHFSQVVTALGLMCFSSVLSRAESPAAWLESESAQLTQLYKELHQSPELSLQEAETAKKMAAELKRLGFQTTPEVGGHGVVGVLKNGAGPTLLLRADMDALPVVEETKLPYASQVRTKDKRGATVGVMHACGHDMHMTNLIGTLRYLVAHRDAWQGTLVAIFQPAEELGAGAKAMLADGLLVKFPRPDFALALHVSADRPAGTLACRTGYALANVDSVDITLRGRGGHGAYPHATIDPVVMAARLVLDLQTIVSREVKPIEPAVITVGSIKGGTKHNVIGDKCELQLTVRSYAPATRKQLIEAIKRKTLATAASADAPEPEIEVSEGTPALWNDPDLGERVLPAITRVLGADNLHDAEPSMGGEDFGRYGKAGVPILMMSLGAVSQERLNQYKESGTPPPSLHSSKFYPDPELTIKTGVKAFTAAALELLKKPGT
ncbi:amidohydrolase [Adhaeretor mobilis]|nr:amidohydrolase [Adhaeretor mobilis]